MAPQRTQRSSDINAACRPGSFDHTVHDDCRTEGLKPDKTHWARPIDTPPYYGYSLRPGVTFTYLGLKVDRTARVDSDKGQIENLWAIVRRIAYPSHSEPLLTVCCSLTTLFLHVHGCLVTLY